MRTLFLLLFVAVSSQCAIAQNLDSRDLLNPLGSSWPTYNGDYSGRRYSQLVQITAANVRNLALVWTFDSGNDPVKATPLVVQGLIYVSVPDKAWALDARTGRLVWNWENKSRGGTHIGHRGIAMYGKWLFLVTPDDYLVSLDAATGKERWRTEIADLKLDYFSSVAPVVIRDHVIVSPSIESTDNRGYLDSYDPETGKLQWRWYSTPDAGKPGAETWPNDEARSHGGGAIWIPGTYDPQLNLFYFGTANPQPVMAGQGRPGDNLWTDSIIALNPDTGKMAWFYQTTPHDTHDWDSAETPVLFDAERNGRKQKLLAQANRNGYFFVLDRTTGEHILTAPFAPNNWANGLDAQGRPIRDLKKDPQPAGALVIPSEDGATNWFPPSLDPTTGIFYVRVTRSVAVYYLTDVSSKPEAWGGVDRTLLKGTSSIAAIDCKTGKLVWDHPTGVGGLSGLLTTAGQLVFGGDGSGNALALDPLTGRTIWHVNLNEKMFNGPVTYELDGRQYLLLAAGGKLFAFALPEH